MVCNETSHKHYLISPGVIREKLGKLTSRICECNEMIKPGSAVWGFLPRIIITLEEGHNLSRASTGRQSSPTITDSVISIIPAECLPL